MEQPVRDLLLGIAAATDEQRPVPSGVDWKAAKVAIGSHGLVPLAHRFLHRAGETVPDELKYHVRLEYLALVARTMFLSSSFHTVLAALGNAHIPVIVLKGPVLAATVYPEPMLRPFTDLDLVCREGDWPVVHTVMLGLGYVPVPQLDRLPPRAWPRKAYDHLRYFKYPAGLCVEVHFDVWETGLKPKLGEETWDRSVQVALAGTPVRMLSAEDQLLHLCVHLQHHSYARLIWFTDIALLLRRFGEKMDWTYLLSTARAEAVEASLYYGLYFTDRLLDAPPPSRILESLAPGRVRSWVHARVWAPDQVAGLRIRRQAQLQLRDVPEAGELILNLLLTGRVSEKLIYLLKLLVPPGAWLAYYYGTDDRKILRRRRLVHAPKLILSALRGIARATLRGVRLRGAPAMASGKPAVAREC